MGGVTSLGPPPGIPCLAHAANKKANNGSAIALTVLYKVSKNVILNRDDVVIKFLMSRRNR